MKGVRSENRNAYARECLNISARQRDYIRNPAKKVTDVINLFRLMTIVYTVVFVALIVCQSAVDQNMFIWFLIGGFAVLLPMIFFKSLSLNRTLKLMQSVPVESDFEYTIDGVGRKGPDYELKVSWNTLKCIRVSRYSIVFLPQGASIPVIYAPVENLEGLKDFMKENNIDITFVEAKL